MHIKSLVRVLPPSVRRRLRTLVGAARAPARPVRPEPPLTTKHAVADPGPFRPDGTGVDPRMNVIGHFRGEFGMAEAARSIVASAQAAGVRIALVPAHARDARGRDLRYADAIGSTTPHPINVVCVNANETANLMDDLGPAVTGARYNIGYWFWELAHLPVAWHEAIDHIDEIWVASGFVRDTMVEATPKPVRTIRLAVDATPSRDFRRSEFGLSDDVYAFLFTFNFNSYMARKNPLGVIRAFRKAFPTGDERVALVLKAMNGGGSPDQVRLLEQEIAGSERIRLIDRLMTRDEVYGLESVVDSYVSLHRSEGFGLGLAECMYLGKPVIGTAYSGNLEFMDPTTSFLIDYRPIAVGQGEYPFPDGQVWADPDEDQAADRMRRLVADPALGREIGARARDRMLREFSAPAVGAAIAQRLGQILDGEP